MARAVALVSLFAVLTVAMAAPWSLHPASRVLVDNADTHLFLWTLGWNAHALATDPLGIFDANIYHPFRNTLAYSENLLGSSVFAAPIIWATGDLVLALNLISLLSCLLCGVGAYVLARKVGASAPAAVLAGVVFAFAPTRFFRMSQVFLNAVQWLPFCLASLHDYLARRRPRDLRWAIGWFSLQALTSGHGAVMLLVAAAALAIHARLCGEPWALVRRVRDIGVTGVLLLLPAVLVLLPYRRAHAEVGLDRSLETWAVTPESFIASPSLVDQWLLSLVTAHDPTQTASAFLFPGYLALLLSAVALWPRRRDVAASAPGAPAPVRPADLWFYALLALVSLSFFVPGPLDLWPWVRTWPGFNFIRVPSRFIILTTLALAVLTAAGFERLASRLSPRRAGAAAVVAGLLLLGEYSAYPFEGQDFRVDIPAADRWLATLSGRFVVAEMPVPRVTLAGPFERFQTTAMLHSTAHWQKTIHGYSGFRPALHDRLFRDLHSFPDELSVASLRELRVDYVVVHRGGYSSEQWADVAPRLRAEPSLTLVHEAGGDQVFAVTPWP